MTNPENDQDPTAQTVPKGDEKPGDEAGATAKDEGGEEEIRFKKPLLGRYNTLSEVVKALKEGDGKVQLSGKEKNDAIKALDEERRRHAALQGKVAEGQKPPEMSEEEQDQLLDQVGGLVRGAKTNKELGKAMFNLFETYQESAGLVTRKEMTAQQLARTRGGQMLAGLMKAHGETEFKVVAPFFHEVWDRQPPGVKATATAETVEGLYRVAKSKVPAEKLVQEDPKKEAEEDLEKDKAGSALGVGSGSPPKKKKSSEEDTVDLAVKLHKQERRL